MEIIKYNKQYFEQYKTIIRLLWENVEEQEVIEITKQQNNSCVFLAVNQNDVIGFVNTEIRTDYVPGSNAEKTGYIEGIFVKKMYRKQQIAKALLEEAFRYFKSLDIYDVGSDSLYENELSYHFHKAVGFKEIEVCRHYHMTLRED